METYLIETLSEGTERNRLVQDAQFLGHCRNAKGSSSSINPYPTAFP